MKRQCLWRLLPQLQLPPCGDKEVIEDLGPMVHGGNSCEWWPAMADTDRVASQTGPRLDARGKCGSRGETCRCRGLAIELAWHAFAA